MPDIEQEIVFVAFQALQRDRLHFERNHYTCIFLLENIRVNIDTPEKAMVGVRPSANGDRSMQTIDAASLKTEKLVRPMTQNCPRVLVGASGANSSVMLPPTSTWRLTPLYNCRHELAKKPISGPKRNDCNIQMNAIALNGGPWANR